MTDLIERVAKAIYERQGYVHCDDELMFEPVAWEELDSDDYPVLREGYRDMARAAIAAMPRTSPLTWGDDKYHPGSIKAVTPFGEFDVSPLETGSFWWGYDFGNVFDCHGEECDSIEDGKAKAQAEWDERLEPIFRAMIDAALNTGGRDD